MRFSSTWTLSTQESSSKFYSISFLLYEKWYEKGIFLLKDLYDDNGTISCHISGFKIDMASEIML